MKTDYNYIGTTERRIGEHVVKIGKVAAKESA